MRLFIAEKPSVAKAIALELGITAKEDGYICCGDDKITWCFGHLLELDEPDSYTPDNVPRSEKTGKKLWRTDELPIIPEQWKVVPKQDAKKQLKIIGKLLKEATTVVNAGDADREGQLLIDEVLEHFNNQAPVLRFWVAAHDSVSLKRGLSNMKGNEAYMGLGRAALARSKADWLIGMNLSRAYTLSAARSGTHGLVTVGRVQTPTLKLVVDRDREIARFKSKPFYTISAPFTASDGSSAFIANWKAKESQEGLDEEERLIDKHIACALAQKVMHQEAVVKSFQKVPQTKQHPKAYTLSDITLEASNHFGYSAAETLKICQSLYETHKLTSYPRTDCAYLPEPQFNDAAEVLAAICHVNPAFKTMVDKADVNIKSNTWNDKKVTVHYGIIPTMHKGAIDNLNDKEKTLYTLIVKRYIAQFYPVHEFESTVIDMSVSHETFVAKGKVITQNGWLELYKDSGEKEDAQTLPELKEGEILHCAKASFKEAKTKPPSQYTEGTLQRAMENIHKVITDKAHKSLLKEGDGIGTPATRASIISELKRKKFIEASGKNIVSTELGQSVIDALPSQVKSPVLTAMFERILKTIDTNPENHDAFIQKQTQFVIEQVTAANNGVIELKGVKKSQVLSQQDCHSCNSKLIRRKGKKGYWWGCSTFPECKQTYPDIKGKPNYTFQKEQRHA